MLFYTGTTVVTRYTSATLSETYSITDGDVPPLMIDVAADSPCEVTSDKPILIAMVVNNQIASAGTW